MVNSYIKISWNYRSFKKKNLFPLAVIFAQEVMNMEREKNLALSL